MNTKLCFKVGNVMIEGFKYRKNNKVYEVPYPLDIEIPDDCIINPCIGCNRKMVWNIDIKLCNICQLEQKLVLESQSFSNGSRK